MVCMLRDSVGQVAVAGVIEQVCDRATPAGGIDEVWHAPAWELCVDAEHGLGSVFVQVVEDLLAPGQRCRAERCLGLPQFAFDPFVVLERVGAQHFGRIGFLGR